MVLFSNDQVVAVMKRYGFSPSESQCEEIRRYVSLLLRWNEKVALTRITKPADILELHFGESLFALGAVPIEHGRLADVGTGAGFPGLAIKISLPGLRLSLVEPNHKKAAFLHEVVRELRFEEVEIVKHRFEEIPSTTDKFDFIAARALGSYPALAAASESLLKRDGRIVLWLGEDDIQPLRSIPGYSWHDPVLIPGSKARFIVIGSRE